MHVYDIVLQPKPPQEDVPLVFRAQPLQEPLQHCPLSCNECKQHVFEEATTLFNAQNEIARPPELVAINDLYVLI